MGSNFSRDTPSPPARFRPSGGAVGQAAAMQSLRPKAPSGPKPGSRRAEKGDRGTSSNARLGLPQLEQPQGDNRHLLPALHHANIKDLGRDLPFGLWAVHNGYFPEIAPKGMEPFDWIEHGT